MPGPGSAPPFGPIILLSLYWRKLTATGAIVGLVAGATTVVVWGNIESLSSVMYEIVPGFAINLLATTVVSLLTYRPNPQIEMEFDEAVRLLDRSGYEVSEDKG